MTKPAPDAISRNILLAYALPAFVVALPTIPVYIHLPALYGVQIGLAATGFILLAARCFDTVTDPLIGVFCDRFSYRGSRRKPWIAVGAVIAGIGLYKVLNPPAAVDGGYLLGWSLVLYAGWTMVSVPYLAWGAELSINYDERTRITSWREGLTLLGIVGAGALSAATTGLGWSEAEATGALAWAAIALGVVFVPLMLRFVPERPGGNKPRGPVSFRQMRVGLGSVLSNRPFLRLLAAWFLNGLANGIPAALFFFYLEYALGAGVRERPLFILVYFIAAIVSIPLWQVLSRHLGKHRTWCWAMAAACLAFVTVPYIPQGAFVAFAAVCVVTGMALGADLSLPPAIQADVVDYDELRSGRARAGLQFALWSMSTKLALAVAVGLSLPGLAMAGFDPAVPTEAGIYTLTVIYSLVPVVIKLMSIAVVWGFPLTANRHAIIRRRLNSLHGRQTSREEATP